MINVLFIKNKLVEYKSDYEGFFVLDDSNKLYIGTSDGWKELTGSEELSIKISNLSTTINYLKSDLSNTKAELSTVTGELKDALSKIDDLKTLIGDLSKLLTKNKDSIVNSINELREMIK